MELELVIKSIKQDGAAIDKHYKDSFPPMVLNDELKEAYQILRNFLDSKRVSSRRLLLISESGRGINNPANSIYRFRDSIILNQFRIEGIKYDKELDCNLVLAQHRFTVAGRQEAVDEVSLELLDVIYERMNSKGINTEQLEYPDVTKIYHTFYQQGNVHDPAKYIPFLEQKLKYSLQTPQSASKIVWHTNQS
ncbi:hypothetical protein DRJ25_04965 [Candidatus Woesearchaeota archaeon]|nr:MAG: hypothetical protein DRJ25_04965 [Candidatus Woesearchaeota archaeon]